MNKTAVVYFSASGVTAAVAQSIAQATDSYLYEIKPKVPYSDADLNWMNKNSRSSIEMRDKSSRPEIVGGDFEINKYDVIFVGFPIWWYTAPTIINTFLESYDFSGKTVILFATSGGSRFGSAVKDLSVSAPGATIKEGKILNGRPSLAEIKAWTESLL